MVYGYSVFSGIKTFCLEKNISSRCKYDIENKNNYIFSLVSVWHDF